MKTNPTQAVDLLDMIFAGRNKAYGAYVLRRGYDRRVLTGLLVSIGLAGLFAILLRWAAVDQGQPARVIPHGPVVVTEVVLPPPPVEPPPPSTPPSGARTVQDVVPVVVPIDTQIDHPVPSIDDLADALPGDADRDGLPSGQGTIVGQTGAVPAVEPQSATSSEPTMIYDFRAVEIPAAFPGGDKALRRFLERNLRTPESGQQGDQSTVRVMVKFIVSTDGRIGGVELLQSGGTLFDEEVKRVLGRMPQWTPARQNGRNVPMYFLLPVVFSLETED